MASPHEDDVLQRTMDAVAAAGGNKAAAARNEGISVSTLKSRVQEAQTRGIVANQPRVKPRIRVPARAVYQPLPNEFGKAVRVLVWGCSHDAPNIPDKSRFRHAGLLATELQPDFIVDLGDTCDMDSLSMHAKPGSMDDRERPFFRAEIASLTEAMAAFDETAPSSEAIPRYHLHGNHEHRAWRHESLNPAAQGVFTTDLDQVFLRFGWTVKNFREWLFIEGIGFIHVPVNMAGKEYSGKTVENTIINEATFSLVFSHTHKHLNAKRPKIGIGNAIRVYNTGSFMPQGYIKAYAGLATTGWDYGVSLLTLRDGEIESAKYWSERELVERFA